MSKRFWVLHGFRLRDLVAVLALFSHLTVAFGFPLPAPSRTAKDPSRPFPCQNRPCGCLTADLCWQGDCCCFTLEEKLAWAEDSGVEPPEHVRPLVESRNPRLAPPRKKSCCPEPRPAPSPSVSAPPTCCEGRKSAATCCDVESLSGTSPVAECPHCASETKSKSGQKMEPTDDPAVVRWVVGIFAQKCRGEGPAGLFQVDLAVAPDLTSVLVAEPERGDHVAPRSDRTISVTHSPPTRPPRSH